MKPGRPHETLASSSCDVLSCLCVRCAAPVVPQQASFPVGTLRRTQGVDPRLRRPGTKFSGSKKSVIYTEHIKNTLANAAPTSPPVVSFPAMLAGI